MSIVPEFVPATAARLIIAQSLTKALAHIRFAESIAETDPLLAEQLLTLRPAASQQKRERQCRFASSLMKRRSAGSGRE